MRVFPRYTVSLVIVCLAAAMLSACGKKIILPEYESAKDQYLFALRLKTNTVKGFDEKSRAQQLKRIESSFLRVIEKFPDDTKYTPAAYINLANTYNDYREPAKAVKYFQIALKKYPGQEDIQIFGHYGLGSAYDRLGRYKEAKEQFKLCVDKFGDDPRSAYQEIVEKARRRYTRIREE